MHTKAPGGYSVQAQRVETWNEAAALLGSLDALRVALTIFDSSGKLLYANAHLNYLLRSLPPHPSLIGCSYQDIIAFEIEGGEIAKSALANGHDAFIAQRLAQMQDGAYAPMDVPLADHRVIEIKARKAAGGRTVLLWSDVTAARAQLARLEEAVALSAEAFAFFDANDRLIMGNALYAQLCGYDNLNELIGKSFAEIVTSVAHSGRILFDENPDTWLERRLKGHQQPAGAITLKTSSGECYIVRDRATPDGGRALAFTDVTDRVRAEAALAEQQESLAATQAAAEKQTAYLAGLASRLDQASAKVDSAKTTLLRTMGHELKTPLNAILGFSDLMMTLADNLSPDQVREYAGLVHQGGTNLLKMISQIMDLTKISAGRYDLRKTAVDAGGVLWLTRDALLARAEARHVEIDATRCPIGHLAQADEAVLSTMLHALVDNAVTFASTTVTLVVEARDGTVRLTVTDDGPGVAPEDLARIQQPFEHAGRAEGSQHSKGAGLGLTLVKAFAELHGGRLDLSSRPGAGFAALITLPAASAI